MQVLCLRVLGVLERGCCKLDLSVSPHGSIGFALRAFEALHKALKHLGR